VNAARLRKTLQAAALAVAAAPLFALALRAAGLAGGLGANPVEEVIHETGSWALRLLLLCLAVTPARRLLGVAALAPLRRTLGLAAFGWACLHVLSYAGLDRLFDSESLVEDVRERRFVFAGLAAYLSLVPLAATSTRAAQRSLGRRWKTLHRLVFVAAGAAVVHYVWLVKAHLLAPLAHGAVLALLVGLRVRRPRRAGLRAAAARRPGPPRTRAPSPPPPPAAAQARPSTR
jgi:sulfoxide reductase heme-binding subunit YedZ